MSQDYENEVKVYGNILTADGINLTDCYVIHKDMIKRIEHKPMGVIVIETKPDYDKEV
jgi:hypothetical protein